MKAAKKRGKRNPIAKALRLLKPKVVSPKKGPGSYKRKSRYSPADEDI